ncbi:MAG: isopropylmalate isomerase [Rhodobacter sp.]|nr:isopropylmalate isomerase [Rhodobacter sp.]
MGWIIAALYLLAAVTSAIAARRDGQLPAQTRSREQAFWWVSAALLIFLAANKQLDLQSLLTSVARCVALDQGWYEDRKVVQRWFVLGVLTGGIAAILALGLFLRDTVARTGLALLGLGFVSLFVMIRAASIHQVDTLIGGQMLGLRVNSLLELPGPLIVLMAATRAIRHRIP